MYSGIDDKDKQVVINLLNDTEQKHQEVLSNAKNKTIDELLTAALGTEKMAQITLEQQKKIAAFSGSKRHEKRR